jgi:hypothetical protein
VQPVRAAGERVRREIRERSCRVRKVLAETAAKLLAPGQPVATRERSERDAEGFTAKQRPAGPGRAAQLHTGSKATPGVGGRPNRDRRQRENGPGKPALLGTVPAFGFDYSPPAVVPAGVASGAAFRGFRALGLAPPLVGMSKPIFRNSSRDQPTAVATPSCPRQSRPRWRYASPARRRRAAALDLRSPRQPRAAPRQERGSHRGGSLVNVGRVQAPLPVKVYVPCAHRTTAGRRTGQGVLPSRLHRTLPRKSESTAR